MAISEKETSLSQFSEWVIFEFQNEIKRYKRKGAFIIVAIVGLFGLLSIPEIFKSFYPLLPANDRFFLHGYFTLGLHLVIKTIINLAVFIIYSSKLNFFEKYRISNEPWIFETEFKKFKPLLIKTVIQLVINDFYVTPLFTFILIQSGLSEVELSFERYPDTFEIAWQLLFILVLSDTYNYWSHRAFHSPFLYSTIHKVHHEYKNPICISAAYFSFVEHLFVNMISTGLGPAILGKKCHVVTFWLWIIFQNIESVDAHCGYEFPWSPIRVLPMAAGGDYHNFHHSKNIGNFGSYFTFWDTVCGTNSVFRIKNNVKSRLIKDSKYFLLFYMHKDSQLNRSFQFILKC